MTSEARSTGNVSASTGTGKPERRPVTISGPVEDVDLIDLAAALKGTNRSAFFFEAGVERARTVIRELDAEHLIDRKAA